MIHYVRIVTRQTSGCCEVIKPLAVSFTKTKSASIPLGPLLLIAGYIWLLPTAHSIALRNVFFFSLVVMTLWQAWRGRGELHVPFAWAWLIYGITALISLTYAVDPLFSLRQIKKELGYGIFLLILFAYWVRDIKSLRQLIGVFVLGNVVVVGGALIDAGLLFAGRGSHPLTEASSSDFGLLWNGPGNFSTYVVTLLPFIAVFGHHLLNPIQRRLVYGLLALNVVGLYFTANRAGMLALLVEIFVAGLVVFLDGGRLRKVELLAVGVIACAVAALAVGEFHSRPPLRLDDRPAIWADAIESISSHPFTGAGFGRTATREAHSLKRYEHGHNILLNKGLQMGLPGMLSFLLLYGAAVATILPRAYSQLQGEMKAYAVAGTAMAAGIIVKNMTDDFFVDHLAFLFWILIGALAGTKVSPETGKAAS